MTLETDKLILSEDTVDSIRSRFGSLRRGSFSFFDAPAGSQVPDEVGDAIAKLMREASGNTGGFDPTAQYLKDLVATTRIQAAQFFGGDAENIVFGGSMTTLNFSLSRAATRHFEAGDEIIVTRLDHEGNVAPWRELAIDRGFVVKTCDLTPDLRIDVDNMRSLITERTKIIAFPWAANTVGSIAPIRELCTLAHSVGALAWVDAVHYAAHRRMDVRAVGADVVLCSPYKFCGPHMGMAHIEPNAAETWRAYKVAARGEHPLGARFETGTSPFEALAGLCATFHYLESIGGFDAIEPYEARLLEQFMSSVPAGVEVYGPRPDQRVPTLLMSITGVDPEAAARTLVTQDIALWTHNFAYEVGLPPVLPFQGDALRVGIAHYNTAEDVAKLTAALERLAS